MADSTSEHARADLDKTPAPRLDHSGENALAKKQPFPQIVDNLLRLGDNHS